MKFLHVFGVHHWKYCYLLPRYRVCGVCHRFQREYHNDWGRRWEWRWL